jgi:hypothetical protein
MESQKLFVNRVAELEELSVKPKIFCMSVPVMIFEAPFFDTISYRS